MYILVDLKLETLNMIPTISPPTDNLYKLISLMGLAILILGVINFTSQSETILNTKIEVEYVEKQITDTIHYYNKLYNKDTLFTNTSETIDISELIAELNEDEKLAHSKNLPPNVTNYIDTEIDIIKIKLLEIKKKENLNYILILFSVLLMIIGFILWYLNDQRWQDIKIKTSAS